MLVAQEFCFAHVMSIGELSDLDESENEIFEGTFFTIRCLCKLRFKLSFEPVFAFVVKFGIK